MTDEPARVLVLVPTYNESATIERAVTAVLDALPDGDVLVIDDNSPDGTGALADDLAARLPHVHVLHRTRKEGLGAAYLAGFAWGLARDYDVLIEMDADGSHPASALPDLVAALEHADLAIGSRWVPGGQVRNWPRSRELLSRGGNTYTRWALGIDVRDATAGFRAFRRATLQSIELGSVQSQGYCFQIDLTRRVLDAGLRIVEVPITFVERDLGQSKMSRAIVGEALWRVTVWGAQRQWQRAREAADRIGS